MYLSTSKLLMATLLLPAFLLLGAPDCFAERADRNEPIHLEADQVIMDDAKQTSIFIGNVRLSQGTLLILGDKIVVLQDKDGFQHATAYGNSAEFRQKRDSQDGYVEGYGERIEYDARTGILNFLDKARLKRDRDEVSGDNITYNTKTEIFRVNGNVPSPGNDSPQRVHAVLQPKTKDKPPSSEPGALPVTPGTTLPRNLHE
jgi:lipopolysaccharide export system protein LptA